jgi:hypothetical protein
MFGLGGQPQTPFVPPSAAPLQQRPPGMPVQGAPMPGAAPMMGPRPMTPTPAQPMAQQLTQALGPRPMAGPMPIGRYGSF